MTVSNALVLLVAAVVCSGCGGDEDSGLRFGGGSCCPLLNALNRKLSEAAANQPTYIVVLPRTDETSSIDNICETLFPLPDDSNTYILYISRVYKNGFNEIASSIVSEPEAGIRRLGYALCQFTDTVFAQLECDNDVYLNQRCKTFGDCMSVEVFDSSSGVYGYSQVRRPISRACTSRAEAAISNNGLSQEDFYILPMRLPSRCVLNQVCTVAPVLQRFCQTVGVAFPAINRCANSN